MLEFVIKFIVVLTPVIFFHELGHFLIARWCGVAIDVFSIGFGREIFGRTDKHGTRWKVSWIPLGGYVKFAGDNNAASMPDAETLAHLSDEEKASNFHFKPLWQRAAVVAAGPIANFILAIVVFAGLVFSLGQVVVTPLVDKVTPGGAADRAGIMAGDMITEVNGRDIHAFSDLQQMVFMAAGETLMVRLERQGEVLEVAVIPETKEIDDGFGGKQKVGLIGITAPDSEAFVRRQDYGVIGALGFGVKQTWFIITNTLSFVGKLVTGTQDASQLGGPIRIATMAGGIDTAIGLISFLALISVSIGLINLFPIPVLDGGYLMFYAIEAVIRKPLNARVRDFGYGVGLAFVISLMAFASWNDIQWLFPDWFD